MEAFFESISIEYLIGAGILGLMARIIEVGSLSKPELVFSNKGRSSYYFLLRVLRILVLTFLVTLLIILFVEMNSESFKWNSLIIILVLALVLIVYSTANMYGVVMKTRIMFSTGLKNMKESWEERKTRKAEEKAKPDYNGGIYREILNDIKFKPEKNIYSNIFRSSLYVLMYILIHIIVGAPIMGIGIGILIVILALTLLIYLVFSLINFESFITLIFGVATYIINPDFTSEPSIVGGLFVFLFIFFFVIDNDKSTKLKLVKLNIDINEYIDGEGLELISSVNSYLIYKIHNGRYIVKDSNGNYSLYEEYSSTSNYIDNLMEDQE